MLAIVYFNPKANHHHTLEPVLNRTHGWIKDQRGKKIQITSTKLLGCLLPLAHKIPTRSVLQLDKEKSI
jgi:hypothetical protein